jgi:hypothetical protein
MSMDLSLAVFHLYKSSIDHLLIDNNLGFI